MLPACLRRNEPVVSEYHQYLSSIDEIIDEARQGRMFILVDDEDRENEGDLVIPAQMATPDAINFMAKFGRGLICLSLTRSRCEQLNLRPMSGDNGTRMQTAFTVSIEAREGVTTGISAADRARTVQVAIDPEKGQGDIVTPGHVFPLMAREGGVLVRAGHTEAAVDISRLAGLNPSGVICEIMNDDGTMARLPDLVKFAQEHNLKIATIADLIAYRRRHDKIVRRELETPFHSKWGGDWRMVVYVNQVAYAEHIALVKGDIAGGGDEPVLVRVHAVNILDDVLGDQGSGKAGQLHSAMETIAAKGRGIIVLVREPRPTSLSDRVRAQLDSKPAPVELRDYGVGAQILLDLGVSRMTLLSNTKKTIVGLEGFGLEVVGQQPINQA
ncbi:3,4-dihydroxy-2-butanone-4-phosphate synthase [Magnetospirillum moscoviense]|uniref:3,4-dihydroxy-2-butanone 4-phosphate synthase n=1 Tax=Magnetospirillum moscoviense TaxID=1437059 RepID=A0A178MP99_9PROT|nr:3,4-dihydroxy-2-butanone-4-phosphate synthase [Magnetospirillum moscoviense]MBF0323783.1 3,4-dihydroxy-2-butanone-4-phosphate synthase [Alphaproteobacteria bacterium]OAN50620.1 3,4-dihydroxy-2-butanone-4-phosphate synthase [Magnetospirillum moscoviense]